MVTITDNAVRRFKELLAGQDDQKRGIRIFTEAGCCGPSLAMDIAEEAKGDVTFEKDGLKVFLEKEANKMLAEATIDFSNKGEFVISGTEQSSCCG